VRRGSICACAPSGYEPSGRDDVIPSTTSPKTGVRTTCEQAKQQLHRRSAGRLDLPTPPASDESGSDAASPPLVPVRRASAPRRPRPRPRAVRRSGSSGRRAAAPLRCNEPVPLAPYSLNAPIYRPARS
jgi:hypothetical protein